MFDKLKDYFNLRKVGVIRWFQDPKSIYLLISLLCVLPALLICTFMGSVSLAFSKLNVELKWMGVALFAAFLTSVANAISSLTYPKARSKFKFIIAVLLSILFIVFSILICVGFIKYFQSGLNVLSAHIITFIIFIASILVTIAGCVGMYCIINENYVKEKD